MDGNAPFEGDEDVVLHKDAWSKEAGAVIQDIRCGVLDARIAERLRTASDTCVYINVTTFEGAQLCIELGSRGFRVVGRRHDSREAIEPSVHYETPYSLLNAVSPAFTKHFGRTLRDRLLVLGRCESTPPSCKMSEGGTEETSPPSGQ